MPPSCPPVTATVIIPAYSLDRWDQLSAAVDSVLAQTCPPVALVLCIDHNTQLLERCKQRWERPGTASDFPIVVVPNRFSQAESGSAAHVRAHGSKRRFGAGWARNTGAELATGDILVFLDDDASADPDWLEQLLAPYTEATTVAVGGAPLPVYATRRPSWFPRNFDWVFGCAYDGMPTALAPLRHLIGANMSVRREVFEEVGGFHSIDFDDLDLCMRVAAQRPTQRILFEPRAIVHHHVPAERVTWSYFWRRCFFVNREKVETFDEMEMAANLHAELDFVARAIRTQTLREIGKLRRGDRAALARLGAMYVGLAMSGIGHVVGRARLLTARSR
jgi:GT2 family glycosyltransferase